MSKCLIIIKTENSAVIIREKEHLLGFSGDSMGRIHLPTCQRKRYKRRRCNPWTREIPWRRKWQPAQVFLPGNSMNREIEYTYTLFLTRKTFQARVNTKARHRIECMIV